MPPSPEAGPRWLLGTGRQLAGAAPGGGRGVRRRGGGGRDGPLKTPAQQRPGVLSCDLTASQEYLQKHANLPGQGALTRERGAPDAYVRKGAESQVTGGGLGLKTTANSLQRKQERGRMKTGTGKHKSVTFDHGKPTKPKSGSSRSIRTINPMVRTKERRSPRTTCSEGPRGAGSTETGSTESGSTAWGALTRGARNRGAQCGEHGVVTTGRGAR